MIRTFRIILLLAAVISPLLLFRTIGQDNRASQPPATPAITDTFFDSDPNHLWNRLHAALFVRVDKDGKTQYGLDSVDPLLWLVSKHLLDGDSHEKAIAVLDEFLDKHGETLIQDPVKRAILQNDLWAVFDWCCRQSQDYRASFGKQFPEQAQALSARLAKIIRRVALTKEQIQSLRDNYAAAVKSATFPAEFNPELPDASFLPSELWKKDGPWVCVSHNGRDNLAAPVHTEDFGGRSAFLIFVNLPNGRKETLDYLKKLNDFPETLTYDYTRLQKLGIPLDPGEQSVLRSLAGNLDPKRPPWLNPDMPQFPAGTKFALVRRMLLIDDKGGIVASPIIMSVQLRVYRSIDFKAHNGGDQSIFEFTLQRKKMFAGEAGGLHAVGKDEVDFALFRPIPEDPLEDKSPFDGRGVVLDCMGCHNGAGIQSVLSHSLFLHPEAPHLPVYTNSEPQSVNFYTSHWKEEQSTWGYLKGLWQSEK